MNTNPNPTLRHRGPPTVARPSPAGQPATRWSRLHRTAGALAVLIALGTGPLQAAAPTDLKWSLTLPQNLQSPALNHQGVVYLTSSQNRAGTIHAVRDEGTRGTEVTSSNRLQGSNPISLPAPVIGSDDTVYFGPNTGSASPGVFALNAQLQRKWYAATTGRGGVGGGIALGRDGVVYKSGGELLAIDPSSGRVLPWVTTQSRCNEDCPPIIGPDGNLYFSRVVKEFNQVNPKTGTTLHTWFMDHEIHSAPAVGDNGLIYLCTTKQIVALNPTNHSRTLVYDPPLKAAVDFRGTAPILGPDGTLYLGNGNKVFLAIDSRTGLLKASLDTEGAINAPAALAADGTVYFGTLAGYVYAVRLEGAAFVVKGRYFGTGKIRSAPAIARDGTVFLTDDSGRLLAFRGTTGPADSAWPMFQQNAQRTGLARKAPVKEPPTFVRQPADQTVVEGSPFTLTAEVTGTGPLSSQWFHDGRALAGATLAEFHVSRAAPVHAGEYWLRASNAVGTLQSRTTRVTVAPRAPALVTSPLPQTVRAGTTAEFVVRAEGSEPLEFLWFKDGQELPGSRDARLVLPSVTAQHTGLYHVRITNPAGAIESTLVALGLVVEPGVVGFSNHLPAVGRDVPVLDADGRTRLAGAGYTAELWAGPDPNSLRPVARGRSGFGIGALAGYFDGGPVDLPGLLAGQPAWFQVRAWDNAGQRIESHAEALKFQRREGVSPVFRLVPLAPGTTVPALTGMDGFSLRGQTAPPTEPILTQEPSGDLCEGSPVRLCVTAQGAGPFTYQWYAGETPIPGETGACLQWASVTPGHAGVYWVSVANESGTADSAPLALNVLRQRATIQRRLPAVYLPEEPVSVALDADPGCHAVACALEDAPPEGWTVLAVSDGGRWDATVRRVKWVFSEAQARTVTYSVLPPAEARGEYSFDGIGSVDGTPVDIEGDRTLVPAGFHPADLPTADWRLTGDEVTAYIAAYRRTVPWPQGPNPIPLSYAVRAAHLYLHGEAYLYDPAAAVPFCWIPDPTTPEPSAALHHATGSPVQVHLAPGDRGTLRLTLAVHPPAGSSAHGIALAIPPGFTVIEASEGGTYDSGDQSLKWVFFDAEARDLAVVVAGEPSPTTVWKGLASFDGSSEPFPDRPVFLGTPTPGPDGVTVRFYAPCASQYLLEASADLVHWVAVTDRFDGSDEVMELRDAPGADHPHRFYRLQQFPAPGEAQDRSGD